MAPISRTWVFFFSFILVNLVLGLMTTAQPEFLFQQCMDGNYTSNSTFRRNLDTALSYFATGTGNNSGNYSITVGQNPDAVYAMGVCRGDVLPDICRSCLNDSVTGLRQRCPNRMGAIGFSDYCMLRYSNVTMFGDVDTTPLGYMWNVNYVSNTSLAEFNQDLRGLIESLINRAAGSNRRFATGNTSAPDFLTLYGLVQCTPDLSSNDCRSCLTEAVRQIPGCCERRLGGRVIQRSCNLRYEVDRFYNETPADETPVAPLPPPSDPESSAGGGNNTSRIIIIIVIPTAISLILIACICIFLKMRKPRKPKEKIEIVDEISTVESLQYDFDSINAATDGFSDSNKLGQGGFGAVYKGMLPNGQKIAVKRLSMNSGQGDLEFKNEVLLVAKLQHRNLVKLLGFCLEATERLLIYEFVQNTSLDHFIFDPVKSPYLDWDRRFKIITGVARGLLYLHEDSRLRIIHRDLKASNILLDREMNAKIADFGMARLFTVDETQGATSRIVGTYGYMAPEYAMHGQFSVKSDVFSFGVLLLEIVSGRKNLCFRNGEMVEDLLSYAWKN